LAVDRGGVIGLSVFFLPFILTVVRLGLELSPFFYSPAVQHPRNVLPRFSASTLLFCLSTKLAGLQQENPQPLPKITPPTHQPKTQTPNPTPLPPPPGHKPTHPPPTTPPHHQNTTPPETTPHPPSPTSNTPTKPHPTTPTPLPLRFRLISPR